MKFSVVVLIAVVAIVSASNSSGFGSSVESGSSSSRESAGNRSNDADETHKLFETGRSASSFSFGSNSRYETGSSKPYKTGIYESSGSESGGWHVGNGEFERERFSNFPENWGSRKKSGYRSNGFGDNNGGISEFPSGWGYPGVMIGPSKRIMRDIYGEYHVCINRDMN